MIAIVYIRHKDNQKPEMGGGAEEGERETHLDIVHHLLKSLDSSYKGYEIMTQSLNRATTGGRGTRGVDEDERGRPVASRGLLCRWEGIWCETRLTPIPLPKASGDTEGFLSSRCHYVPRQFRFPVIIDLYYRPDLICQMKIN